MGRICKSFGWRSELRRTLQQLTEGQEKMKLDIQGIKDQLTQLEGLVSSLQAAQTQTNTALGSLQTSLTTEFQAIGQAISDFESQLNSGAGITQADLDALRGRVAAAAGNLAAAVTTAQTASTNIAGSQASVDSETATVKAADPGSGTNSTTTGQPTPAPASVQGPLHGVTS